MQRSNWVCRGARPERREPVETVSAHWIADPGLREAIADFLERERAGVAADRNYLATRTPFRQD